MNSFFIFWVLTTISHYRLHLLTQPRRRKRRRLSFSIIWLILCITQWGEKVCYYVCKSFHKNSLFSWLSITFFFLWWEIIRHICLLSLAYLIFKSLGNLLLVIFCLNGICLSFSEWKWKKCVSWFNKEENISKLRNSI